MHRLMVWEVLVSNSSVFLLHQNRKGRLLLYLLLATQYFLWFHCVISDFGVFSEVADLPVSVS